MTRLYISADLEGVCGIMSPLQCYPQKDRQAYEQAVNMLAEEVNMVVDIALECGAQRIVVNDSHGPMTNLRMQHISSPFVTLLSGKPKVCAMSAGLEPGFDAAIYLGYHAKAGTERAVLCHTFHDKIFDVVINGKSFGETGVNALYAGLVFQIPVILASGDDALCLEAEQCVPGIETVRTKTAVTYASAIFRPKEEVYADYQEKLKRLFSQQAAWRQNILNLDPPYRLEVTFIHALAADTAMMMPGWTRMDGRTIAYQTHHFQEVYQALQSAYAILSYSNYLE